MMISLGVDVVFLRSIPLEVVRRKRTIAEGPNQQVCLPHGIDFTARQIRRVGTLFELLALPLQVVIQHRLRDEPLLIVRPHLGVLCGGVVLSVMKIC